MSDHELPADQLPGALRLPDEEPVVVEPGNPDILILAEGNEQ